jgi:allophanate hydrolase subunit 2
VALCGAQMRGDLPPGIACDVPAGAELSIGAALRGYCGYLAIAGGFDVPRLLDSRSAWPGASGALAYPLRAGTRLSLGEAQKSGTVVPAKAPELLEFGPLRLVPGPQLGWLDDASLLRITQGDFGVGSQRSRVGVCLFGPALGLTVQHSLRSQGVLPGALQLTPDGQLIVLGWDGPVTGGYPVPAVILEEDLRGIAQAREGACVRFVWLEPDKGGLWI